jgi:hypothetical protein
MISFCTAKNTEYWKMKPSCAAVLALFLGSIAWAQDSSAPKILIPLLVQDSHQRPVRGLTAASLAFSENKTPVAQVSLLNAADLPLELGLVVDSSNSERDADLNDILEAAKKFVIEAVRGPQDQAFFLTFDAASESTKWLKREQLTDLRQSESRWRHCTLRRSRDRLPKTHGTAGLESADAARLDSD